MNIANATRATARKRKAIVVVAINLAVGGLHFVTGADYPGPWRTFVNGHLIGVALPFAVYFLLALNDSAIGVLRPWFVKSAIVFGVVSSAEAAQCFGIPMFGETYDPWDFVAYAAGSLLAAATDRILFPRLFPFWTGTAIS